MASKLKIIPLTAIVVSFILIPTAVKADFKRTGVFTLVYRRWDFTGTNIGITAQKRSG